MTIHHIQELVCTRYGVRLLDLLSARRDRPTARTRQIAMWLCRHTLPCTLSEIGRAFGNRDHTTVIAAIRRVDGLMAASPPLDRMLMAWRDSLTEEIAA